MIGRMQNLQSGEESPVESSPETPVADRAAAPEVQRAEPIPALPGETVKPSRTRSLVSRWWTPENVGVTKEFVGLVAAFLAVLAAVLGFFLNAKTDEADGLRSKNLQLQTQVGTLREQVSGLEGRNTELRDASAKADQEMAQLRAQLPAAAPVGPDIPSIRKAGTLKLAVDGDSIQLNSTDSNFGATPSTSFDPDALRYSSDGLMFGGFGDRTVSRVRLSEAASYGPCSIASGWSPVSAWSPVDPAELSDGQTCLRLASGRIATIKPTLIASGGLTLQITVWQRP